MLGILNTYKQFFAKPRILVKIPAVDHHALETGKGEKVIGFSWLTLVEPFEGITEEEYLKQIPTESTLRVDLVNIGRKTVWVSDISFKLGNFPICCVRIDKNLKGGEHLTYFLHLFHPLILGCSEGVEERIVKLKRPTDEEAILALTGTHWFSPTQKEKIFLKAKCSVIAKHSSGIASSKHFFLVWEALDIKRIATALKSEEIPHQIKRNKLVIWPDDHRLRTILDKYGVKLWGKDKKKIKEIIANWIFGIPGLLESSGANSEVH